MISVRVIALNEIGESLPSAINSGDDQLVEKVPFKPPTAPTKNFSTTQSILVIDYLALEGTANGGSEVTSYQIMWNQGESVDVFVEL